MVVIILLLVISLYVFAKKSTYFSEKEKEFVVFVMDIFKDYGDTLGIQSKDEHKKLVNELEKIKKKHF